MTRFYLWKQILFVKLRNETNKPQESAYAEGA